MSNEEIIFIKNLEALFPLVYAIPSLVLYVWILCLICANRAEFGTSFYRLFIVCGIADIHAWIFYYINIRTATAPCFFWFWQMLPNEGFWPAFIMFISPYLVLWEFFLTFMLIFNRFTCLIFTLKSKLWNTFLPFVVIISILFPVPFLWQIPFNKPMKFQMNATNILDGFGMDQTNKVYGLSISLSTFLICSSITLLSGIMNGVMICYICKAPKTSDILRRSEMKLAIFSMIMFIYQSFYAIDQILFYLNGRLFYADISWTILFPIQKYVLDLTLLSPPWFLTLMSSSIRQALLETRILKWILRRRDTEVIPIQQSFSKFVA